MACVPEDLECSLSLRISFPPGARCSHKAIFTLASAQVDPRTIGAIAQLSSPTDWCISLTCKRSFETLLQHGTLCDPSGSKFFLRRFNCRAVSGKICWLPPQIPSDVVSAELCRFGDLTSVTPETETVNGCTFATGPRLFCLNLKVGTLPEDVPHFVEIAGHKALITIRGRAPVCARCVLPGHISSKCPQTRPRRKGKRGRRGKNNSPAPQENAPLLPEGEGKVTAVPDFFKSGTFDLSADTAILDLPKKCKSGPSAQRSSALLIPAAPSAACRKTLTSCPGDSATALDSTAKPPAPSQPLLKSSSNSPPTEPLLSDQRPTAISTTGPEPAPASPRAAANEYLAKFRSTVPSMLRDLKKKYGLKRRYWADTERRLKFLSPGHAFSDDGLHINEYDIFVKDISAVCPSIAQDIATAVEHFIAIRSGK